MVRELQCPADGLIAEAIIVPVSGLKVAFEVARAVRLPKGRMLSIGRLETYANHGVTFINTFAESTKGKSAGEAPRFSRYA